MPKGTLVTPKTYFVGSTALHLEEVLRYLNDTDQVEFTEAMTLAHEEGLSDGEILCSMYAKLCYSALTTKKNENISKVRDIYANILGTVESGHFSVFEHCQLNFIISNCSRVFTHELVRHRVGTAFSQTSGRYVRSDKLDLVIDPILDPVNVEIMDLQEHLEKWYGAAVEKMGLNKDGLPFSTKKKMTSALRRMLPNGQANEMGFSCNLRALRHTLVMRTSEHAEWEIRLVFNQIADLVKAKYPAMFADAITEEIDSLLKYTFTNSKL